MRTLSAIFAGLLAVLLLARVRRVVALSVAGVLVCGAVLPQPVYAQIEFLGLFSAIDAVLNTINGVLKGLLDLANSVLNQIKRSSRPLEPDGYGGVSESADRTSTGHGVGDDRSISGLAQEHLQHRRVQRSAPTSGSSRIDDQKPECG
jgi:hypothetical protein